MNSDHDKTDKLWIVRDIISSFGKNHTIQGKVDNLTIYKGKSKLVGVNMLMLCDASGMKAERI